MPDRNEQQEEESTADDESEESEQAAEPRAVRRAKSASAAEDEPARDRNRRIREEAAAKRRAKREGPAPSRGAPARNLDAGEIMDDAVARGTHAAVSWLRRNANLVQWLVLAAAVGGIGWKIYSYRQERDTEQSTSELARALRTENARIAESKAEPAPDEYTGLGDPRPAFKTDAERLTAAAREYEQATRQAKGDAATLARLGMAGIRYDQGKFAEAKTAYAEVKSSGLAQRDQDVKGRAIEGVGLSLEALGKADEALGAFRELENTDISGLSALGLYHQARLLIARGEKEPAKERLKKALEKLTKGAPNAAGAGSKAAKAPPSIFERLIQARLMAIDPNAVPPPTPGLDAEALERLKAQLKTQGGKLDGERLEALLKDLGAAAIPSSMPAPAGSAP